MSTLHFPGLFEFKNNRENFLLSVKEKLASMTHEEASEHFNNCQRRILQAGTSVESQRNANTFFDMQVAILWQRENSLASLIVNPTDKKAQVKAKAKKATADLSDLLSGIDP